MLRTILLGTAAALALGLAPAAHAEMLYDIEIDLRHSVSWEYQGKGYPDECREWSKGSGSQSFEVRTKRPKRVQLEILFGKPAITGYGGGERYSGLLDRVGTWKSNWVPMTAKCWPCGPLSEFGECEEEDPPPPLSFRCTTVKPLDVNAAVSYRRSGGLPDIREGLVVRAWARESQYYDNCPPTIKKSDQVALKHQWPSKEWAKLPVEETNRIMELKRGRSVTIEVTQTHMYANVKGKVTKGERCSAMPDVVEGYGECAVSDYKVKFTRVR